MSSTVYREVKQKRVNTAKYTVCTHISNDFRLWTVQNSGDRNNETLIDLFQDYYENTPRLFFSFSINGSILAVLEEANLWLLEISTDGADLLSAPFRWKYWSLHAFSSITSNPFPLVGSIEATSLKSFLFHTSLLKIWCILISSCIKVRFYY